MDATEKKAFRKSLFGGFSKDDVNSYIVQSTEKYTSEIRDLKEKYSSSDKEREELSAKLHEAEEKIALLEKKSAELDNLKISHSEQNLELESAKAHIKELENSEAAKSERIAYLEMIEAEYAARKTELADIEIAARARAAAIIGDAEREATRRSEELERELDSARRSFSEKRNREITEAGDMAAGISRLVDSLKNEISSMDSRITRIADSVRNNVVSLSDAVCDAQNKISGIRDRLSDDGDEQ